MACQNWISVLAHAVAGSATPLITTTRPTTPADIDLNTFMYASLSLGGGL
jgi:hypothetical protein